MRRSARASPARRAGPVLSTRQAFAPAATSTPEVRWTIVPSSTAIGTAQLAALSEAIPRIETATARLHNEGSRRTFSGRPRRHRRSREPRRRAPSAASSRFPCCSSRSSAGSCSPSSRGPSPAAEAARRCCCAAAVSRAPDARWPRRARVDARAPLLGSAAGVAASCRHAAVDPWTAWIVAAAVAVVAVVILTVSVVTQSPGRCPLRGFGARSTRGERRTARSRDGRRRHRGRSVLRRGLAGDDSPGRQRAGRRARARGARPAAGRLRTRGPRRRVARCSPWSNGSRRAAPASCRCFRRDSSRGAPGRSRPRCSSSCSAPESRPTRRRSTPRRRRPTHPARRSPSAAPCGSSSRRRGSSFPAPGRGHGRGLSPALDGVDSAIGLSREVATIGKDAVWLLVADPASCAHSTRRTRPSRTPSAGAGDTIFPF